ncbi:hypothetical protein ACRW5F_00055 [Escherichia coli]
MGNVEQLEEVCQSYQVNISADQNLQCEVVDVSGTACFGLILEIDRGVPTLHIHAAHNGLVLIPDSPSHGYENAPVDRFSYNSPSLWVPGV